MRYAALCSGIGGLELAVEAAFGDCELAWHAEIDTAAAIAHERHWPLVPNVGDITAADWSTVEPVDLMCFGFPCQDLSFAGKGAGIEKGTRSGLWFDCLDAVRVVRPRFVVVENVAALVTRRDGLDFSIVPRVGVERCLRSREAIRAAAAAG